MPLRSKSRSNSYQVEGNHLVDTKSKQILFKEFEVATLGRTMIKGPETFSQSKADSLVADHMKKKRKPGTMNFLVDRIRFGKVSGSGHLSNREYLTYREIKQCYRFETRRDTFMLCVEEEGTNKRSYETYRCQNAEDLNFIIELINKTTNDSQFLMRIQSLQNQHTYRRKSSDTSQPESQSDVSNKKSLSSIYENKRDSDYARSKSAIIDSINDPINPSNENVHRSTMNIYTAYDTDILSIRDTRSYESPIRIDSPPPPTPHRYGADQRQSIAYGSLPRSPVPMPRSHYQMGHVKVLHRPSTPPDVVNDDTIIRTAPPAQRYREQTEDSVSLSNITYVDPYTPRGPEVNNRGSVYLYVARSRNTSESKLSNHHY